MFCMWWVTDDFAKDIYVDSQAEIWKYIIVELTNRVGWL